jgi:hypothetical protein
LFILIDTDLKGMTPFYDYLNELDDKPLLGFEAVNDYRPNGNFHIVDTFDDLADASRWKQLYLATLGARAFTDRLDENSPIWAGPVPDLDKIRKISVDASFAEGRAGLFAGYGVNYVGRTKLSPRNIFILDNKKGNPLHDPSKDAVLEALYASLPDDWWGSCGFVSASNVDTLGDFLDSFQGDVIPLAFTTGAYAKLKYLGLSYVDTGTPRNTEEFGVHVRDRANRLSYALAQPEQPEIEEPKGNGWLQL